MSILGAIKGAIGGFLTAGPYGAAAGAIGGAMQKKLPSPPGGMGTWSGPRSGRVLPGVGTVIAGAAGYFGGRAAAGAGAGGQAPRRRTRGFSSRDVRQAKRIMKMLKDVSAAAPKPRMIRASAKHCD